tara:strand:+ start:66 stop:1205 length:1140 start_codon:yes stop_codon:yes gene_type:complete
LKKTKKIFYWSPSLVSIATNDAVINSAYSLSRYEKSYKTYIFNFFGEFERFKEKILKKNIATIDYFNKSFFKFLPKHGKINSRFSFIIIFLMSFFPLKQILKKEQPDYLIVHLITSLPLILLLFFDFKTKFILRISGFPQMNFFRKLLWKLAFKKIYKVTCPTLGTYNYLKKLNILSDNKIHLLYDPIINVKEALKKRKEKNVEYKNYFLAAGRLTKQKDFNFLCKATKDIVKKNKDLKILIAGVGEEKNQLIRYVNNNNLQKNIIFLNFVDNIYPYFFHARAFILTSLWEDPGFVLIEAAFSRTLVLSNDSEPGPKDIIKDSYNGIVYKKKNIDSFKEKFDQVLKNKNRKTLIYNNLKNVRKFTIFNHFKSFDSILSD